MGVPAEEYGDVAWRVEQARAGKLEFLGGKPELLRLGHFDDVDMAMMIHTTSQPEFRKAGVAASNNGCIVKTVRYIGRASHAGGAPHLGINALYAAQIGLAAINAIRETFRDDDSIRVHPIITHGGSQVNVIPADVRLETYVRGKTVEAILDANVRVDRALVKQAILNLLLNAVEATPAGGRITVRLVRRGAGRFVEYGAHPTMKVDGRTGKFSHALLHHAYPTLRGYIDHMNSYSSMGAEIAAERAQGGFLNIVARPFLTFIYNYFFRLGFLDGREGLLLHLYHAVYVSWKYAKAWELSRNKQA